MPAYGANREGHRGRNDRGGNRTTIYKPRCDGKVCMMFVGGSRSHHYMELFNELGMKTIAAGL